MAGHSLSESVQSVQGQGSPRMHDLSPEPVTHLSQHRLVPMLLKCASSNDANSSILFDHTVLGVKQSGESITVAITDSQVYTDLIPSSDTGALSVRAQFGSTHILAAGQVPFHERPSRKTTAGLTVCSCYTLGVNVW